MRTPLQNFGIIIAFEGGIGLVGLILGQVFGIDVLQTVHWSLPAVYWGIGLTLPLYLVFLSILRSTWSPFVHIKLFLEQTASPLFANLAIWQLAVISISAGIGEELFFRGFVQAGLNQWLYPEAALIVASIFFGMAHFITPTYAWVTLVIGIVLGLEWMVTQSLIAPIITHSLYDFIALVTLFGRKNSKPLP